MQAFANVTRKIQAYGDKTINSQPRLKYVDWNRDVSGQLVSNPRSESVSVDPGGTVQVFSGVRSTTVGSGTTWAVSLSPLDPSRYRFTWTGGQNPGLRTDRGLSLNAIAVTFTPNLNNTVDVTVPGASPFDFGSVVAGDYFFVPGPATGDGTTPFSVMNQGLWQVLSVPDSDHIVVTRPVGSPFTATLEVQTPTSNTQLIAFSAAGVQAGDTVDISAGFPLALEKAFQIVAVTSSWFEVISTSPLPASSGNIPGTAGMIFYDVAKTYVYLEADQEAAVQVNGDTGQSNRISPVEAGNTDRPGWYEKRGVTWSLSIVNRSAVQMNATIVHWE